MEKKKMTPAELIKYAADNHIKITLSEKGDKEFYGQKCQDRTITEKFRKLHTKLVNEVISFCKENNVIVDTFNISTDGLRESINYGEWCPCTDSCFRLDEDISFERGKDIYEMTDKEYKMAKIQHEPYLFSM